MLLATDFFSRKTDDDSDFDLDSLPNDGGAFKISSSRGRGAPKSRSEIMELELKKLVKNMTQAKRDALKKQTEKEKEKLAIEVRAFTDEQGKIRAGQVCSVWMKTSIPLILIQDFDCMVFFLTKLSAQEKECEKKMAEVKKKHEDAEILLHKCNVAFKHSARSIYDRVKDLVQKKNAILAKSTLRNKHFKGYNFSSSLFLVSACFLSLIPTHHLRLLSHDSRARLK